MVTSDPTNCLQLVEKNDISIDLLITDIMMPKVTGPNLYQILLNSFPRLRALFLSGHPKDFINEHGINTQEIEYLQKI